MGRIGEEISECQMACRRNVTKFSEWKVNLASIAMLANLKCIAYGVVGKSPRMTVKRCEEQSLQLHQRFSLEGFGKYRLNLLR